MGSLRCVAGALILTLLAVTGCSGGGGSTDGEGRIEVLSDGTRQVTHATLPDRTLALDTLAVLDIYGPQNEFPFSEAVAIVGDDDTFLMIDRNGAVVVEVDPAGRIVRTIGRRGDGPGEFQRPGSLCLREGNIWVLDNLNRRVSRFDRDGAFRDDFTWDPALGPVGPFDVLPGGGFLYLTDQVVLDTLRVMSLVRLDPTRVPRDTLSSMVTFPFRQVLLAYQESVIPVQSPPIFAPYLWWDTSPAGQEGIATATSLDYVIERFGLDGRRLQRLVGPTPDLRVTRQIREWWFDVAYPETAIGLTLGRMDIHPSRQALEAFTFVERRQAVRMLCLDPTGRLWVSAATPDPEVFRIDIFDPDGRYLGHLPAGAGLPGAFLTDGRGLFSWTDEDGIRHFFVDRLRN